MVGRDDATSDMADDVMAIPASRVWSQVAGKLRKQLSTESFQQWFANIVPVAVEDGELHLGVSDDFFADFLSSHYGDLIVGALQEVDGADSYRLTGGFLPAEEEAQVCSAPVSAAIPATPAPRVQNCNKHHTFANFVIGEENRYAYSAARRAAEEPGLFNPLFIHGNSGTGKTHLLQAVAHAVKEGNPQARVRYATCEEILNHYVDSLRTGQHAEFRSSMRDVDLLLVDDVHHLANKTQLQEQFFNAFNTLYNDNKQIILTSDRQPCEITGLEARLVSRFESGVTTEITVPGFETRLAILKMMQQEQIIKIDEAILRFIATNITANVRRLKGALLRLVAVSSVTMRNISMEDAERQLHKLIEEENAARVISIETIQQQVARYFELHVSDLLGDKRPRNIAEPRMIAMYLSRVLTNCSFPEIGQAFGKNHATIMNAMKKVPELCEKNETLRRSVALIERQLKR